MSEELKRTIEADPDDLDAWLVYSDWLIEQGDFRGDLVAADVALESSTGDEKKTQLERREQLIETHGEAILGSILHRAVKSGFVTVTWRFGYVETLSFVGLSRWRHLRTVKWLADAMIAQPEPLHFLRVLNLTRTDLCDEHALAPLPNLRQATFKHTLIRDVERLAQLFPKLQQLDLSHTKIDDISGLAALERLTSLELTGTRIPAPSVKALQLACPDTKIIGWRRRA
jgi:uncharacterized protein (TIGR02996 family)